MKPILFNTDMVRTILDGNKTVTRRVIRYKYSNTELKMLTNKYGTRLIEIEKDIENKTFGKKEDGGTWRKVRGYIEKEAPYQIGDILWVRESFCPNYFDISLAGYRGDGLRGNRNAYKADYRKDVIGDVVPEPKWKPSIHMPKEAARIFLKIINVSVGQLWDMTHEECLKEGVKLGCYRENYTCSVIEQYGTCINFNKTTCIEKFKKIWNSTIRKDIERYGWDANPWVWVIEFERKKESELLEENE